MSLLSLPYPDVYVRAEIGIEIYFSLAMKLFSRLAVVAAHRQIPRIRMKTKPLLCQVNLDPFNGYFDKELKHAHVSLSYP